MKYLARFWDTLQVKWLYFQHCLSDWHFFNKCQQEVNCKKKMPRTNYSVWNPECLRTFGWSRFHQAWTYSCSIDSEKNVHTVLSIQLGQKTTCTSNCTRCWTQSKQRKRDGQRLGNTHTAMVLVLLYVLNPSPNIWLKIFEILVPVWPFRVNCLKFLVTFMHWDFKAVIFALTMCPFPLPDRFIWLAAKVIWFAVVIKLNVNPGML